MFLLGLILRLQKSCCLYSEKRMGGGGVAGGGWLASPEQICEAFRLLWSHICTENYRIRNSYNTDVWHKAKQPNIIWWQNSFWPLACSLSWINTIFLYSLGCVALVFNEKGKNGTHKCTSSHSGWFHCWLIVNQRFGIQKWNYSSYIQYLCVFWCSHFVFQLLPDSIICPHKVRPLWVMLRFIKLLLLREPNNEPSVNMKTSELNKHDNKIKRMHCKGLWLDLKTSISLWKRVLAN